MIDQHSSELLQVPSLRDRLRVIDQKIKPAGTSLVEAYDFRETVRKKYSLPPSGWRWENPTEYIRQIEQIAKQNDIDIRPKHEYQQFFEDHPIAGAVSLGENVFRNSTIVVSASSETDFFGLRDRANQLSHERVHALQDKKYPRITDALAEREAYYYQQFTDEFLEKQLNLDPPNIDYLYDWINTIVEESVNSSTTINSEL